MTESMTREASNPAAARPRRRRWGLFLAPLVILVLVLWGVLPRIHARRELRDDTRRDAATTVLAAPPTTGQPAQEVVLPGNIRAFIDAPIYARTNGYLRRWYADIGTHVHKGQLLAEIETPEADQQLAQARADLASSQANANLAQTTAARYQNLLQSDSVSKQETDNAVASATAQSANVTASQANVKRLAELRNFQRIEAPFDGVITARNTDIGQLINSGAGGGSNELFHIADVKTLRIFVNVPQTYAPDIKAGMPATLSIPELAGHTFTGRVVRTADAIDPGTRTLLVEVDIDNRNGELLAGSYGEVHFNIKSQSPALLVPVSALLFRSEGLRIALVDQNSRARLVPVTLGRDYGNQVEVVSGLQPHDRVITTPPDSVIDGQQVRVITAQNESSKPAATGGGPGQQTVTPNASAPPSNSGSKGEMKK